MKTYTTSVLIFCPDCIYLLYYSSANKSPTFRLIQQIYDDMIKRSNDNKASIESIQGNIESELSSIRNFTRQSTDGEKG